MSSKVKEIPLVWLAASACTGCSISLLNTTSPSIKNILIDEIIPGVHINLRFHQTIMAGSGEQAVTVKDNTPQNRSISQRLLVLNRCIVGYPVP